MDRVKLVQKEQNPINRLMLGVTFSFIITAAHPLASCFSSNDGGHLKN